MKKSEIVRSLIGPLHFLNEEFDGHFIIYGEGWYVNNGEWLLVNKYDFNLGEQIFESSLFNSDPRDTYRYYLQLPIICQDSKRDHLLRERQIVDLEIQCERVLKDKTIPDEIKDKYRKLQILLLKLKVYAL